MTGLEKQEYLSESEYCVGMYVCVCEREREENAYSFSGS